MIANAPKPEYASIITVNCVAAWLNVPSITLSSDNMEPMAEAMEMERIMIILSSFLRWDLMILKTAMPSNTNAYAAWAIALIIVREGFLPSLMQSRIIPLMTTAINRNTKPSRFIVFFSLISLKALTMTRLIPSTRKYAANVMCQ